MDLYSIGNIVRENRERVGMSQEDLSFDLCAVSTLSRIESGKQVPGRKLAEALFSRMGLLMPNLGLPMTKADYERANLEFTMTGMAATSNYEYKDLLERYKTCGGELDILEKQFYEFFLAIYETHHKAPAEQVKERLENALRISVKGYVSGALPKVNFMTKTELMILNNIAREEERLGNTEKAIEFMEFLKAYFESGKVEEEEMAKNYPVILFNLAEWKIDIGDFRSVEEIAERGIQVCVKYGKLTYFPFHLFYKGYALAKHDKKEEGRLYINDAFRIFERQGKHENVLQGAKVVNKEFGFVFPEE